MLSGNMDKDLLRFYITFKQNVEKGLECLLQDDFLNEI